MRQLKLISLILIALFMLTYSLACAVKQGKTETFNPSKTYQGALAINLPATDGILAEIRQRATADGEELGPVEYYEPGEKDFEPIIAKLMSRAKIDVLWIAGGIMDIPNIQKAVVTAGYTGQTRLKPVSGAVPFQGLE